MATILSDTKHIARKRYVCNACEWIENDLADHLYYYKFTCAELREIVKARRNRWCIVPGQQYRKQVGIESGDFYVWRVIPAIDAICRKYDIYEYA